MDMDEYYVFDQSVPSDNSDDDGTWNAQKESESRQQGKSLRDYFTMLAKSVGVDGQVGVGGSFIGFAPPVLQIFTDAATAKKLEVASKGRLFISKLELQ